MARPVARQPPAAKGATKRIFPLTPPAFSSFDAAAIIVVLAAVFSYLNARYIKLPQTIGLTILGAVLSILIIAVGRLFPHLGLIHATKSFVDGLDFRSTLLDGMLSFLLFAGAFQVNLADMRDGRLAILVLSSVGTVLSTVVVGFGLKLLVSVAGQDLPLIWCFVFGALISPTDPVAVIAILRKAVMPPTIQATVAAESLFNDGVGVVVFSIVFAAATGAGNLTLGNAAGLFALEAGGGIVFGLAAGGLAFAALRGVDDYAVEVLITLATVMGGYALAQAIGVSGPVAMAVAGLVLGNQGLQHALYAATKNHVVQFWELLDELLNAVLFLLIGLEAIAVWTEARVMLVAAGAIPIVLLARLVSVALPLLLLRRFETLGRGALAILWWGGLRGGISIALALSIPAGPGQPLILAATYAVVFFSVLVQGATIGKVAGRYRAV